MGGVSRRGSEERSRDDECGRGSVYFGRDVHEADGVIWDACGKGREGGVKEELKGAVDDESVLVLGSF